MTLLGMVAIGAVVWGVQSTRRARRARQGAMPDFYAKALARLARRGLRPAPSETAREFCARVGIEAPALAAPFSRVTAAYESVRFGKACPGVAESRDLLEIATRL
jgi:hypothetical protein